jgi:hypothetical protein
LRTRKKVLDQKIVTEKTASEARRNAKRDRLADATMVSYRGIATVGSGVYGSLSST